MADRTPLKDAIANAGKDGEGLEVKVTKTDGLTASGSINTGGDTALSGAVSKSLVQRGWDWWVGFSWRPK